MGLQSGTQKQALKFVQAWVDGPRPPRHYSLAHDEAKLSFAAIIPAAKLSLPLSQVWKASEQRNSDSAVP